MWADAEPREDSLDLEVSPALLEATRRARLDPQGSGFATAGMEESSALEESDGHGPSRVKLQVEAVPVFAGRGNPGIAPHRYVVERLPNDVRETTVVYPSVKALREAVARADAANRQDAAASAWHAEPILRFLCATFGDGVADLRVSEEGFIVVTAGFPTTT